MTGGNGVGPTGSPRPANHPVGQASDAVTAAEQLRVKQPETATSSAASLANVVELKTLEDGFDASELGGPKFLEQRSGVDDDEAMPPLTPRLELQLTEPNLNSTEVSFARLRATLVDFMSGLKDEDPNHAAMDRDNRLAGELVGWLKREGYSDDDSQVQDAHKFRRSVSDYWAPKMTHTWRHYPQEKRRKLERDYQNCREKAEQSVLANRPELAPADEALRKLDDLKNEVFSDPRLRSLISAEQKKRLTRDLETLRDLIKAGKQNGWLPDNGSQVYDHMSLAFMEDRVCSFAEAIQSHIGQMTKTKGGIDDGAHLTALDGTRQAHAEAAKAYLSELEHAGAPPKAAWFVLDRRRIAEAFQKAHPTRGREIMDSLPPDFLADLIGRGTNAATLVQRLEDCSEFLHVSQSGFGEGTGTFAFFKGLGRVLAYGRRRKLSSWQAAQVRRAVAMLAVAGATKGEIRQVRRKLVGELRNANLRIGRGKMQAVEASVSPSAWDAQQLHSLSSYRGEIEQRVAREGAEEQKHWRPLANLHTAMDNISAVLEAGASASGAMRVFNYDMRFLGKQRIAAAVARRESARYPQSRVAIRPDGDGPLLPRIAPPPSLQADLAAEAPADAPVIPHPLAHLAGQPKPDGSESRSEANWEDPVPGSAPSAGGSGPRRVRDESSHVEIELVETKASRERNQRRREGFGTSTIMRELFGGDLEKSKAFDGDPVAFQAFKGDEAIYKAWGRNAALYKAFGSRPEELEGEAGAQQLKAWADRTYGNDMAERLFALDESLADGVGRQGLESLGSRLLQLDSDVERAHALADLIKEKINALHGEAYGTTVGDSLVEAYLEDLKGGATNLLGQDDLREIEERLAALPQTVNSRTVEDKLAEVGDSVPSEILTQWKADMANRGTIEPSGAMEGEVRFGGKPDTQAQVLQNQSLDHLKRMIKQEADDKKHPEVSASFWTDIERVDTLCRIDDGAATLTRDNAIETLKQLTGGDPDVTLNLSKLVQQRPLNTAFHAVTQDLGTDRGEPLQVVQRRSRDAYRSAKRPKISVRKSGTEYVIDYRRDTDLVGFVSGSRAPVKTNSQTSHVIIEASIRVDEKDLKEGRLENLQIAPIRYEIDAQLDPCGLIYSS